MNVAALGGLAASGVIASAVLGVLPRLRHDRHVRERMRTVVRRQGLDATGIAGTLTIRARTTELRPLLARAGRLAGYDAARARHARLPWPLTMILCCAFGTFDAWRAGRLIGQELGALAGIAGALIATRTVFQGEVRAYAQQVYLQMPDALGLMIRAVQAGVPVTEALRSVARDVPEPSRSEFGRVVSAVAIGRPLDQAIWSIYHRTKLAEYSYLAVTLGLQAQTGGSLVDTLGLLADMIRKRVAMAARASALASEAKVSMYVLIALPFLAGSALALIQPGYLATFTATRAGSNMLALALGLIAAGAFTMRWLTRRATKG